MGEEGIGAFSALGVEVMRGRSGFGEDCGEREMCLDGSPTTRTDMQTAFIVHDETDNHCMQVRIGFNFSANNMIVSMDLAPPSYSSIFSAS